MKFFRLNIPILISSLALLFFIFSEVVTFIVTYNHEKELKYNTNKKILDNLLKDQKEKVSLLALSISMNPDIIEAYEYNDPESIKTHILPIWNRLREEKLIYEIHFFKPPAISFVNFSNFNSIGKDVSDVRKDIEWVSSSFKSSKHIMMCKTYPGIRATYPIVNKKHKMLGGLSMGKKIDWLPQTLKKRTGDNSFLVYKKESTKTLVKKYLDAFLKDKQLFSKYILAEQTIDIPLANLNELNVDKPISSLSIDGKTYIINSYPIVDFNNNTMAYIFTLNDFEVYFNNSKERLIRNSLIILLAALIIYFIINTRLSRILGQAKYISKLTQAIKKRDFSRLNENNLDKFNSNEVLYSVNSDVIDMGKTIEKKYLDFESKILKQLYTDNLTYMPNRNAMTRDFEHYKNFVLILFNIRSFRQVNEVFGFHTGNDVLKELAKKLMSFTGECCKVYHIGSDEFSVLLTKQNQSESDVTSFVRSMLSDINNKPILLDDGLEISIDLYAGICMERGNRLVKADMALAKAKKENLEYYIYTEAENTIIKQEKNIEISSTIKKAIENDNIVTVYQPIFDAKTMDIVKYEALVRMFDGENLLTPYHFLDVSMQINCYKDISATVIKSALDTFRDRSEQVSINLDMHDLNNHETLELIYDYLNSYDSKDRVIFELTETNNIYESEKFEEFVKEIKKIGAKIAIDDFGTGYANFAYLMQIRPDFLKIDGSIIKNLATDESARKILYAIVTFANELNIKTIAEFVHDKEVLEICKDMGVDELQGFYLGEPAALT